MATRLLINTGKYNSIKKLHCTCGNVHSDGEIVINPKGQLNCLTPSIKYKSSQCQYPAENSLESNACFGVNCIFLLIQLLLKNRNELLNIKKWILKHNINRLFVV